jgi:hypothetical protein
MSLRVTVTWITDRFYNTCFLAQITLSIRNIFCVYEVISSHCIWLWTDPPQDAENITLIMMTIKVVSDKCCVLVFGAV